MRARNILVAVALVGGMLAAGPAANAQDEAVYQRLITEKAGTVVSVKLVLLVKVSGMGPTRENETNSKATGIVVDSSGLVMIPQSAFEPSFRGLPRRFRNQVNITSTPVSIRVVFPGDTKEYDAVLGAKDSKLGLAFILIKELGDKQLQAVDMSKTVEPKIGMRLYGVTRLGEGFDHAPMCTRALVSGAVTKPRAMWIVQGASNQMAKPLYDATGAVAGVMVEQEGVGENAGSRPFLLPLGVARSTVAGGLKKAKAELERILEEEEAKAAEAADEAAEGEDGEKKDPEKAPEKAPEKDGDGGDK